MNVITIENDDKNQLELGSLYRIGDSFYLCCVEIPGQKNVLYSLSGGCRYSDIQTTLEHLKNGKITKVPKGTAVKIFVQ